MYYRNLISCIIITLFLYACNSDEKKGVELEPTPPVLEKVEKTPEQTAEMLSQLNVQISAFPPRFPDMINPREYMQESDLHVKGFEFMKLFQRSKSKGWKSVQEIVTPYIKQFDGTEHEFYYKQVEALAMIDLLTQEESLSDEALKSLSEYTQTLLDYQYNRVYPIAESLKKLEGYWDKNQISEAAKITLRENKVFNDMIAQARLKAKEEGNLPESGRVTDTSQSDFFEQLNELGVNDLERMAQ